MGIIDSVDTTAKTVTLRLEDGEIGAVKAGDICMGIYHSLDAAENAAEDYDDSLGNRRFAGFCTVYFTITEVTGDRNQTFKYQVRPVSERWTTTYDPFPEMTFVCYGSFTDEDRQTSVYETRTYTRMLWKQNTWEISAANIAMQTGDLSNLSVHGMQMEGYSVYLNSVYFTGTIRQVKPDGTPSAHRQRPRCVAAGGQPRRLLRPLFLAGLAVAVCERGRHYLHPPPMATRTG